MNRFVIIAVLSFAAPLAAAEQRYDVRLSDYGAVAVVVALANGESLDALPEPLNIMRRVKSIDAEFIVRARPAYRPDGDMARHAKGFYEVRVYLWRQAGPLAALDYQVRLSGFHGAETAVHSRISLDVRRFSFASGDRLVFMLANIGPVHRLINRVGERMVLAAEWGIVNGIAAREQARRDREREARRAK